MMLYWTNSRFIKKPKSLINVTKHVQNSVVTFGEMIDEVNCLILQCEIKEETLVAADRSSALLSQIFSVSHCLFFKFLLMVLLFSWRHSVFVCRRRLMLTASLQSPSGTWSGWSNWARGTASTWPERLKRCSCCFLILTVFIQERFREPSPPLPNTSTTPVSPHAEQFKLFCHKTPEFHLGKKILSWPEHRNILIELPNRQRS